MLIGRKEEKAKLTRAYKSNVSEFVAVYGRRRIGKTFLVRETFEYRFAFTYTGIAKISNKDQLTEFHRALNAQGANEEKRPKSWFEAFAMLGKFLNSLPKGKKVVFIDELPWMDSPRSHFVEAFGNFWNAWASARKDILLIICGSASSWIINKIFRNKGGLHNRVTTRVHLSQFDLRECEEMARAMDLPYVRQDIVEGYMVMGGVPFYWSRLVNGKSMAENINDLFFMEDGEFRHEFHELYSSLFSNPEKYEKIIAALATKKTGMTRDELLSQTGMDSNGRFSQMLENLIECGFVRRYCDTTKRVRDSIYQLVDCYTLFHYKFQRQKPAADHDYWRKIQSTSAYSVWCGFSFERVCLLHIRQIKESLGISGILSDVFSWHVGPTDEHPGAQIDLLIDRSDNVISICEMKYSIGKYKMTKKTYEDLTTKLDVFRMCQRRQKGIQLVLVTMNGISDSKYNYLINKVITSDDLFRQ